MLDLMLWVDGGVGHLAGFGAVGELDEILT